MQAFAAILWIHLEFLKNGKLFQKRMIFVFNTNTAFLKLTPRQTKGCGPDERPLRPWVVPDRAEISCDLRAVQYELPVAMTKQRKLSQFSRFQRVKKG